MNILKIVIALLLSSCAEDRLYHNGQLVAVFQGDLSNVTLDEGDYHFHADRINNSKPTGTAYTGICGAISAVSSGVIGAAAVIK